MSAICVILYICHTKPSSLVTCCTPSPSHVFLQRRWSSRLKRGGVRVEKKERAEDSHPSPHPCLSPPSLSRLKHKHNWTCWKTHNGTEGGKWSHTLKTHGCPGQGAINPHPHPPTTQLPWLKPLPPSSPCLLFSKLKTKLWKEEGEGRDGASKRTLWGIFF